MLSGSWYIDIGIALIGAIGLIVPGWLAYKGSKVGKNPSPATEPHGGLAWEHSKTRDFISREHDETRRQMHDGLREMRGLHHTTVLALLSETKGRD